MDSNDTYGKLKAVGCSVMMVSALALGACAQFEEAHPGNPTTQGRNLDAAKTASLGGGSGFNGSLARNYYAVATRRAKDQDLVDADYFARKSMAAASGQTVLPERGNVPDNPPAVGPSEISAVAGPQVEPHNWLIPGNADPNMGEPATMLDARNHLVTALDRGGRDRYPVLAARAQALYDCWIERSEHLGATGFNGQCRQGFVRDYSDLNVLLNPPGQRDVYFDLNSARLTPEGQQQIKQAVALIQDGTARLKIVGKADRSGSAGRNMQLSQQRAEAIRTAAIAAGLPANRIDVQWTGENTPPVATKDNVVEKRNRVVEISTLMPVTQAAELPPVE